MAVRVLFQFGSLASALGRHSFIVLPLREALFDFGEGVEGGPGFAGIEEGVELAGEGGVALAVGEFGDGGVDGVEVVAFVEGDVEVGEAGLTEEPRAVVADDEAGASGAAGAEAAIAEGVDDGGGPAGGDEGGALFEGHAAVFADEVGEGGHEGEMSKPE